MDKVKSFIYGITCTFLAIAGIFLYGKKQGKEQEFDYKIKKGKEVEDEINSKSDSELNDIARDKWMRNKED